jgi:predicted transcriptional regulator
MVRRETVRELRIRKGFGTIAIWALVSQVEAKAIAKIEQGLVSDPRHSTHRRLSQALGVSHDTFQKAIDASVAERKRAKVAA